MMSAKNQYLSFLGPDVFAKARANANNEGKVFDWDKAAQIIKERQPELAEAGLAGDWEYTGGVIYKEGRVCDDYTYLASAWAVPTLIVDGEEIDCWVWETNTEWDAKTSWPDSSKEILSL